MSLHLTVNKPEPIVSGKKLAVFSRNTDIKVTIRSLENGKPVLIGAFYSDGLLLLKELQLYLKRRLPNKSFREQRAFRSAYHRLSNLILIEIVDYKLNVKKAPNIGWLKELYPNTDGFLLTFPQVQGLNSSWQWNQNGISIPVLRNKVHPYYGVYFPTRFDHLILFDNWLKRYEGPKKTAIDIRVDSGIISLQLVKHGFQKVFGTDTNPNAIIGLTKFMGNTKLSRKIELDYGYMFGKWEKQTELIVFNPPWLPEPTSNEGKHNSMYYNENLFSDFFTEAAKRLLPNGKLVVMFSNLAQITKITEEHPIEQELENGGRFQLEQCFKKKVKAASSKTKRNQHWRSSEKVELWILTHK